jgi:hypothetical protein
MSNRNWHEEREKWEQDRALYELELQKAYAEASNRRARWLMAAFACHAMTAMLMVGWRAFLAVSLAAVSAALLSRVHVIENEKEVWFYIGRDSEPGQIHTLHSSGGLLN